MTFDWDSYLKLFRQAHDTFSISIFNFLWVRDPVYADWFFLIINCPVELRVKKGYLIKVRRVREVLFPGLKNSNTEVSNLK